LNRKIIDTQFAKIILLMLLFIPLFSVLAKNSEIVVIPTSPRQGDNVTFLIKDQPGEEVEVSVYFANNVTVTHGEFNWILNDVYVPSFPNSFSVVARDVETLHVSVKSQIWLTKSVEAVDGFAEVSQRNVREGTYDVHLHGRTASSIKEITLEFTSTIIVTIGPDGYYMHDYDTDNIPVGSFTVNVREKTSIINLAARESSIPEHTQYEVFEIYTCEDYDEENHLPIILTRYFDVSGPGVMLWFNMSYFEGAEVSVRWVLPDGDEYFLDNILMPRVHEQGWIDFASRLLFGDGDDSISLGLWSVELVIEGSQAAALDFNIIDKGSSDWGYRAEIVDVKLPKKIFAGREFTVEVFVEYDFASLTLFTPGLWDPETEDLIEEKIDELDGSGSKSYRFTVKAADIVGSYVIDVAAFYEYDNEWFFDEGGLYPVEINVEEPEDTWIIPGFPASALLFGLVLSVLLVRYYHS
jgi:hypothetical protein